MYDAMAQLTGETNPHRINELIHLYKVRYSDKYMVANTHLYPQTRPMLTRLKEKGARICIVSTKTRSRIQQTYIDCVIGIEDVRDAKPSPQGIQTIQSRFHLPLGEILYIGDSLIDAQTAANAHVDFAAVTTGTTSAADFTVWPHVQIMHDLSELL